MILNSSKMMFMMIMTSTTLMILTSNNTLLSWMMMEINLISFTPLLTKSKKMNDQVMKYLIIQSCSSSMMLMSILMNSSFESPLKTSILLTMSMLMKMGIMPMHLWLPTLMQAMDWTMCMMISTIQKIAPTIMLSQLISMEMLFIPLILSLIASPITGLKQLSTKKIMAYSSISNSPWMIMATKTSKFQSLTFFVIYTTITISIMTMMKKNKIMYINQTKNMMPNMKLNLLMNILSMSGMPPLLGFFPKWMILQSTINSMIQMAVAMIISSTITTFVYMKMMYPILMNKYSTKYSMSLTKMNHQALILNTMGIPIMLILKSN